MSFFKTAYVKTGSFVNRYSPQILVGTGIAMGIGSTILAIIGTIKAQPKIESFKEDLVKIHKDIDEERIDEKEGKKELARTYKSIGIDIAKHYSIPLALTIGSVGCTLSGVGILNKRYAGVSLALGGATASLDRVYKRLTEEFGEDKAKNYIYGLKDATVKENEVDPDTGEVKKVKKTIKVQATDEIDDFTIDFDGGPNYAKDINYDYMFVTAQQSLAQLDLDNYKTPIFLDDVLGKHYLNLPVKSERLLKMMHHVGWPVGSTISFGPEVVYDISEDGTRTSKLVLHFTGLTGNPWDKGVKETD